MAKYYDELLKLCAFEDEEISRERSRIERVFQRLELGPEDMKLAEEWVRQNHEVELMGVRMILGLWLRELIDLVLAKEEGKKLVYFGFPSIVGPTSAIAEASEEIYCTCPDVVLCYTLGQIFNKLNPILEAGEDNGLPAGHSLCSLLQIRVGSLAKGIVPVPDLVLMSSYFCDMGSKADELLKERYGHPAVFVDGSMDSRWGEFPAYLPERVDFLGQQINKAYGAVKEVLGVEVTEEAQRAGASRTREVSEALAELVELMKGADPQPISVVSMELARRLTNGSASKRIITEGPEAIRIMNREVKERIDRGIGVVEKGAPRVALSIAHFSDPRVTHMIEDVGLSMPTTLLASFWVKNKPIPILSGEVLADVEMARGFYHSNYGFIKGAAEAAKEFNVDGVIHNYLFSCRPSAEKSHLQKQFIEKETGVPVLALETDIYDSRTYSAAALRPKVEVFAEILRARKASVTV